MTQSKRINTTGWVLDPLARQQLTNIESQQKRKLKGPECRVLELLVAQSGEVVSKENLLAEAWAGRIVTEASLTQSIAQIRMALGDSGKEQKYIKTVPNIGYAIKGGIVSVQLPEIQNEPESISDADEQNEVPNTSKPNLATVHTEARQPTVVTKSQTALRKVNFKQISQYVLIAILIGISVENISTLIRSFSAPGLNLWQEENINGIKFHYLDNARSKEVFNYLKQDLSSLQSPVKRLFISSTAHYTYIACTYPTSSTSTESLVKNLSFNTKQDYKFIKETTLEHCQ